MWVFKTCIRVRGFYQVYFGDFPLPSKGIVVVIILKSRLRGRLGSFQACNGSPKALSGLHLGWKVDGMWPDINGIPQTKYGPKSFYGDLIVIFEITQIKCKPVLDGQHKVYIYNYTYIYYIRFGILQMDSPWWWQNRPEIRVVAHGDRIPCRF